MCYCIDFHKNGLQIIYKTKKKERNGWGGGGLSMCYCIDSIKMLYKLFYKTKKREK